MTSCANDVLTFKGGDGYHSSMQSKIVAVVGTGALGTSLAMLLSRANWPLAGLWDEDHHLALTRSLLVGCSAYPSLQELLLKAELVLDCRKKGEPLGHPAVACFARPESERVIPFARVTTFEEGCQLLPGSYFGLIASEAYQTQWVPLIEAIGGLPLPLRDDQVEPVTELHRRLETLLEEASRLGLDPGRLLHSCQAL